MRLVSKLLLAAAAVVASLLLLEIGARVVSLDPNPNPRWRYDASLGWTVQPSWQRMDSVNSTGFRHRPASPDTVDRRRLLVLGDSFALGGRYPYDKTFSGLLDQWLNGVGPGTRASSSEETWDVTSLAVGGWGTGQQWLALAQHGLALEPDVVVLQVFPHNDLCNNNPGQAFTCSTLDLHRPYFQLRDGELVESRLSEVRHRLRRASHLFGWFEARLQWRWSEANRWPELAHSKPRQWQLRIHRFYRRKAGLEFDSSLLRPEHQPEVIRTGWEITEALLGRIAEALDQRGIPLIGVVIPLVDTFDETALAARSGPAERLVPDYATATTESILSRLGATTVSVRHRILEAGHEPRKYFHPHDTQDRHLNFIGHYSVASWILDEMRRLKLTSRPSPRELWRKSDGPL